ncbi:nuclear transport factor 2 family protein [Streptomyces sp. NPDC005393]|uniref:nuclear transport factor 2 family protein n=1 Tax=Streptomyces sp. NPDC005393 TaxID=3157041 RepID=UPI0033B4087F
MMTKPVPAEAADLLRRMYDVFNTQDVDAMMAEALHPEVDWPNVADNTRLHGHAAVQAYWQAQFDARHPLVSLEGLALGPDGRVVATVRGGLRDADGDHWAEEPVEHVYTFRDGLITHMEVRAVRSDQG